MVTYIWQLESDAREPLARLRGHSKALAEAVRKYRARMQAIDADTMGSELWKTQEREKAKATLAAVLDAHAAQARVDKQALERLIAEANKVERGPEESLAYETRAARLWARYKGLLDADQLSADELVDREKENSEALEVLREELPDYLRTRKVHPDLIENTMQTLDSHATPLLPETQRWARKLQAELAQGYRNVETATAYAREEHQTGNQWNVLPDWEKGSTLKVE